MNKILNRQDVSVIEQSHSNYCNSQEVTIFTLQKLIFFFLHHFINTAVKLNLL